MPNINEKKITVESVIEDLDPSGITESSERCKGEYDAFFKTEDGLFTLSYREESEGGRVDTDITVCDDLITVSRTGAIESVFRFAEGMSERSVYKMPPYEFDAEITTVKIRNNLTRVGGELVIFYDMAIGGAKRRVRMRVTVPTV